MVHLDLFSGIGGFAYAMDEVWNEPVTHVFCEIDPFCQAVLRKHWPGATIHGDIRTFADSKDQQFKLAMERQPDTQATLSPDNRTILTGGFPCQPFSAAGKRRGTSDDRHLWPEMLRVIRSCQPQWVVAENVRGLLTLQGGLVFEQVCLDLEASGYVVQPFIIPAVAVNAPHRRDRVWFVANRTEQRPSERDTSDNRPSQNREANGLASTDNDATDPQHHGKPQAEKLRQNSRPQPESTSWENLPVDESQRNDSLRGQKTGRVSDAPDTRRKHGRSGRKQKQRPDAPEWTQETIEAKRHNKHDSHTSVSRRQGSSQENPRRSGQLSRDGFDEGWDWDSDWTQIAARLCSVDDGLPARLGETVITKARHRKEQLKAYGNAIVPEVAKEIMRAIKLSMEEV